MLSIAVRTGRARASATLSAQGYVAVSVCSAAQATAFLMFWFVGPWADDFPSEEDESDADE
jgi:hypothetical protein